MSRLALPRATASLHGHCDQAGTHHARFAIHWILARAARHPSLSNGLSRRSIAERLEHLGRVRISISRYVHGHVSILVAKTAESYVMDRAAGASASMKKRNAGGSFRRIAAAANERPWFVRRRKS